MTEGRPQVGEEFSRLKGQIFDIIVGGPGERGFDKDDTAIVYRQLDVPPMKGHIVKIHGTDEFAKITEVEEVPGRGYKIQLTLEKKK